MTADERAEILTLLTDCRDEIVAMRDLILESACHLDADGNPIRDTLDWDSRPEVERMEALLARLDAKIAAAMVPQ